MPSLKIKATEMKDATVSHISLVDRGANRSPFKVIKQEKSMSAKHLGLDIDLSKVFSRKAETPKPEVLAVVTMKEDGTFEAVKAKFEEAGFTVAKSEEQEDKSVVFAQAEGDLTDDKLTVVRLSEDCAVVVKAFRPYNMDFDIGSDGTSFADVCKAQGFYPGIGTMMDVMRGSVLQAAEKSDTPADAAAAVKKMFSEAAEYAVSMIGQLPAKAFKLEQMAVVKSEKKPDDKKDDESQAASDDAQGSGKTATDEKNEAGGDTNVVVNVNPESVEKADLTKVPVGVEAAKWAGMDDTAKKAWWAEKLKAMPAKKSDETVAPVGVTMEQVSDVVAKGLESFASKFAEMLAPVKKSVEEMGEKVGKAEVAANKATAAVSGTTVLGSDGGDQSVSRTKKNDNYVPKDFDTAYSARNGRRGA